MNIMHFVDIVCGWSRHWMSQPMNGWHWMTQLLRYVLVVFELVRQFLAQQFAEQVSDVSKSVDFPQLGSFLLSFQARSGWQGLITNLWKYPENRSWCLALGAGFVWCIFCNVLSRHKIKYLDYFVQATYKHLQQLKMAKINQKSWLIVVTNADRRNPQAACNIMQLKLKCVFLFSSACSQRSLFLFLPSVFLEPLLAAAAGMHQLRPRFLQRPRFGLWMSCVVWHESKHSQRP